MEFRVSKTDLSRALDHLTRVIPSKSSNPILTAVHAHVEDGTLTLSGSSLEVDVRLTLDVDTPLGAAPLTFAAPAHLLTQLVRNAPGGELTLDVTGNRLTLNGGKGHQTTLQLAALDDYPALTFPGRDDHHLSGDLLRRALRHVEYAASSEAFQAVFRGIRVELHQSHTRFVASDGYRLAIETQAVPDGARDHDQHFIIPGRSAALLVTLLKDVPDVRLALGDGILHVTSERARINVKLMDGAYPDYTRVIPPAPRLSVTVDAAALIASVARVMLLCDEHANYRLELAITDDRMTLRAENDYGRAQDTVDATVARTEEGAFEIAVNARMLRDALAGREGQVTLALRAARDPIVITDTGCPDHTAIVVPLREGAA